MNEYLKPEIIITKWEEDIVTVSTPGGFETPVIPFDFDD